MGYERELLHREIRRWARREVARGGQAADTRPAVRALEGEDVRAFDNQALFYDQSGELIPGIDTGPNGGNGNSANFRWPGNSMYVPVLL